MYENGTIRRTKLRYSYSPIIKTTAAQNNIMAIGEMAFMKDNGYGMPMNKEEDRKNIPPTGRRTRRRVVHDQTGLYRNG